MKELEPIVSELSKNLEMDLHGTKSPEELKRALSDYINYLITNDFNKLMRILYRVDVSEKILRTELQKGANDAGNIIADLIIDRQLQKIRSRQQFSRDTDIADDEKW